MNNFNKRVYEMLNRIVVFATTFPQLFQAGSIQAQLLGKIQAAGQTLSESATSQVTGAGAVRRSSGNRSQARSDLRSQLETISRTARGLKLPEFWMPRNRGDQSLLDVGKSFLTRAQPLKQTFIDGHLPADFIERLDASVQSLGQAINDQTVSNGARTAATEAIDRTRIAALDALQQLDPLMENLLQGDPPTLKVWRSCRHVARAGAAKPAAPETSPPAGATPVPTAPAAAG